MPPPPLAALPNRIALIEDHPRLASLVERGLGAAGIAVDIYPSVETAWHAIARNGYAAAVIDRGLPDGDGLDLVRRMRAAGNRIPCLMLTARDGLHDRVDGLDAGADDYLPKPFAIEELTARVRALMRRPSELRALDVSHQGLYVKAAEGCMRCGDEQISLAPAELQIILSLVHAGGQVVRRSTLEAAAWGVGEAVTPNALDVALHRLRRKLAAIESGLGVVNVRNLGFALRAADAAA
ncbi:MULTISPECIES: response regulator transcription factor [unclassified Stenotrophomonas]|jgi:DNA-binding response OmpR family regulator|uniref:response regulator transcription factor n=1 Tax=unclassified Stenotrophomonas TaxID=196198 RepID=UPI0005AEE12D|nr:MULTISPECIES: response regulator transcription factor [unclassified Stenotrophomonas]KIP87568.1 transcriptional regulator [Stenotrophomonas maltophilia]MBD8642607.1 response regulator transcription factor [Stenotrophomonas sp. CFBP 13724]MDY1033260.1 response regulator transcription factor [Stenotrophomonas sp. CFBP8980]